MPATATSKARRYRENNNGKGKIIGQDATEQRRQGDAPTNEWPCPLDDCWFPLPKCSTASINRSQITSKQAHLMILWQKQNNHCILLGFEFRSIGMRDVALTRGNFGSVCCCNVTRKVRQETHHLKAKPGLLPQMHALQPQMHVL